MCKYPSKCHVQDMHLSCREACMVSGDGPADKAVHEEQIYLSVLGGWRQSELGVKQM